MGMDSPYSTLHSQPPTLPLAALDALIQRALDEDVGPGDVTSMATVGADVTASAHFLAKEDGVAAGLTAAERVFAAVDPELEVIWTRRDGAAVLRGTGFGTVLGRARSILAAERLALNLMQRMSGIATATHHMVEAARPYRARILDTRKTAPGLRILDKWAVRLGGGENHRIGLYDMILIKDNHIAAAGGIAAAVGAARRYREEKGLDLKMEVETRTLAEVRQVLELEGVDLILLDNMVQLHPTGKIDAELLKEAVDLVGGRLPTEASGNVTLATVPTIASTGVDYISAGALTHSVTALDISLKISL